MKPENHLSKYHFLIKIISFCFFFFVLILHSCVTQRRVEYMQDDTKTIKAFDEAQIDDYRLKPEDELFIQINSLDDPTASIFSTTSAQQMMSLSAIQPYGAALISYTVDKEGFLLLPVIGRISVQDKTIAEVSETITNSLSKILSQPLVSIKLVNRYVTVLGEVLNPGHHVYANSKLTIYDAIGLAGDITEYGNRKEVILTRNENGKNIRIPVNLTKSDVLESEYYYIRPNDIVYVKPMRRKFWAMRQFSYTDIISTITTAILLYTIIAQ